MFYSQHFSFHRKSLVVITVLIPLRHSGFRALVRGERRATRNEGGSAIQEMIFYLLSAPMAPPFYH